ncbi:MarR family winged helix-turn-helix transcriptional regulator [Acidocella aquatica]|nr:MarR family transcriptional regulator [Acidocella aquatica]
MPRSVKEGRPGTSRRPNTITKPEMDPVKNGAAYMLQVVARLQTTSFIGRVAGSGVHPAGAYVLHELWRAAPLSQTELSKRLDIGNATVGQTVKRLESRGLVKRKQSTEDRRVVMVELTAKGRSLEIFFDRETQGLTAEINGVLGLKGTETLTKLLTRLADHFRASLSTDDPEKPE